MSNGQWVAAATLAIMVIMGIWMATGFYSTRPGEATAVQTFGAARAEPETQEGLHWHWPWPIGATRTVQVDKSRKAEIGYQTLPGEHINALTGEGWQRDLQAATMITGDLNLLEIQLVAQYYISDLNEYLFAADDPGIRFEYLDGGGKAREHRSHPEGLPDGQSVKDAMEIAIRRSIGHRTIDRALVTDRETIELETMRHAQDILDVYRTGLTITAVQLQEIKPPTRSRRPSTTCSRPGRRRTSGSTRPWPSSPKRSRRPGGRQSASGRSPTRTGRSGSTRPRVRPAGSSPSWRSTGRPPRSSGPGCTLRPWTRCCPGRARCWCPAGTWDPSF